MNVNKHTLPIVAIGASAGGVNALQTLFDNLPEHTGAVFVVIVHLAPDHQSEMAKIIATRTAMPVIQVEDRAPLNADCVYVIPPNRSLLIADDQISTSEFDEPRGQRAPIDVFFKSLAKQQGDAFAVILTGAGSDGAIGVKAIKEAGGVVLIQDPNEAEYASMPRNAIATGVADIILPVREIASQLIELIRSRERLMMGGPAGTGEEPIRRVLAHLRARTGHDFSKYKRSTVLRRLARRMQITHKEKMEDYYALLRESAEEVQSLFGDLLISVTTFFRDSDAFKKLAEQVIQRLFEGKGPNDAIRVWVPGCATGEEAYSIAILLLEEAARHEASPEIQVFASDLDPSALGVGREGLYPDTIEADVSEARLRRFFIREGQHYRVRRELRDCVLFVEHSLLKDPPFSRLDLISCRNLLIYLDKDLQQQAYSTFSYALLPGGFLFLGSSETADGTPRLFGVVDRDARIYQSLERSGKRRLALPGVVLTPRLPDYPATKPVTRMAQNEGSLHRRALEEMAPPSMLVDESYNIIHMSDTAGRYLQHPGGPPTTEATELVRPELRLDLRSALHRAFQLERRSLSYPIPVQFNGTPVRVYVQVRPLHRKERPRLAVVFFIEGGPAEENGDSGPAVSEASRDADETIQQLRDELRSTRSLLKTSREEEETANEELRAANEELQSINEEYRSTAEELETSKEELQSINEELQTLNNELKLKLEGVSRAHNDLQNLIAATDMGTLFLDSALRIKWFTPSVANLFNITFNDEGRPITDFTHSLDYEGLPNDAKLVIRDLVPIEREVRSAAGAWYMMRLRPYRTIEDRIEGVVVTFVDVTERRRTEEALRVSERRLQLAGEASQIGVQDYDFVRGEYWFDDRAKALWGIAGDQPLSMEAPWCMIHPDDAEAARKAINAALDPMGDGIYESEFRRRPEPGEPERWIRATGKVFFSTDGNKRPLRLVGTVQDVSERKAVVSRQRLLLDELSHRVRNMLAVVQSMARQTFHDVDGAASAQAIFEGRLAALASAQELLVQHDWRGAELGALARSQLSAHLQGNSHLKLSGPQVMLPPALATPIGLVLHELATNAAKYGALSNEHGHVVFSWRIKGQGDEQVLEAEWTERNGPPVNRVAKPGFGSYIIDKGVPGGVVKRDFQRAGLVCTMEIPLGSCAAVTE